MPGYNPRFDLDLSHGEKGEGLLWDLLHGKRVEVKRDRAAWRTGNLCVEFRSRGKASGIAVSTAEWWAFVVDDAMGEPRSIVMIQAERLKVLARDAYVSGNVVRGGDDNTSEMVLVPMERML